MSRSAELGSALLSKKQARDDKFRKRRESWEKRAAWAEVLVPPIIEAGTKAVVTSNMEEFDNNSALIKENQDYALALDSAQSWLLKDKKAQEDYGGNVFQYYANIDRPEAERRAAEALRQQGMNIYVGDHGPYQEQITELVDSWAEDSAAEHEEAMNLIRKIGTPEEYASLVGLQRSKVRSDNIFGTLFQKAKNYATGTSQEEIDARAIQSIANSRIGQSVDLFNLFQKEYKENNNVMQSYDYTKWASNLKITDENTENEMLWTPGERKIDITDIDNVLIFTGSQEWVSLNDPSDKRIERLSKTEINFNEYTSPEAQKNAAEDIARTAYREYNFHDLSYNQFTTEGFRKFRELVAQPPGDDPSTPDVIELGGTGLDIMGIESSDNIIQNGLTVARIYDEITKNPAYVKNEVIERGMAAQFDSLVTGAEDLLLELAGLEASRSTTGGERLYQTKLDQIRTLTRISFESIMTQREILYKNGLTGIGN